MSLLLERLYDAVQNRQLPISQLREEKRREKKIWTQNSSENVDFTDPKEKKEKNWKKSENMDSRGITTATKDRKNQDTCCMRSVL